MCLREYEEKLYDYIFIIIFRCLYEVYTTLSLVLCYFDSYLMNYSYPDNHSSEIGNSASIVQRLGRPIHPSGPETIPGLGRFPIKGGVAAYGTRASCV